MSDPGISKTIADFIADKDSVQASEIAAMLMRMSENELRQPHPPLTRALAYRGATSHARDSLKKPRLVEVVLEEEQGELYEEYSEFLWIGENDDGENIFIRRRALFREQYQEALTKLRLKQEQLRAKIERYQADYDRALPHWATGMTFGTAIALAGRHHLRRVV